MNFFALAASPLKAVAGRRAIGVSGGSGDQDHGPWSLRPVPPAFCTAAEANATLQRKEDYSMSITTLAR